MVESANRGQTTVTDITARDALSNAIRYWEPRRILFNVVLAVVAATVYLANWPHSARALSFDVAQELFVLAVQANVAYSAAYLVDVPTQLSAFRVTWLRLRSLLLAIGCIHGAILANFFAHQLFR